MGAEVGRAADEKGPLSAFVWKTIADPFAGRITMFRVISGTLKSDSTVQNKTKDTAERLGSLVLLQGKVAHAVLLSLGLQAVAASAQESSPAAASLRAAVPASDLLVHFLSRAVRSIRGPPLY